MDHTGNGVNVAQKRFILQGSHHFWCEPNIKPDFGLISGTVCSETKKNKRLSRGTAEPGKLLYIYA